MKFILWDFDGTLAFREGLWTGTLMSVLKRGNFPHIKKEDVRPFLSIGFPWNSPETPHVQWLNGKSWWEHHEDYFREIFEIVGIEESQASLLAKKVKDEYLDPKVWRIYEDVPRTLRAVREIGCANVILSNHTPELPSLVESLGLKDDLAGVYTSGTIGYEKPNKKIFEYVLEDLRAEKKDCLMVGDSYEADIAGALRSGLKAILVRKDNPKDYRWYSKDLDGVPGLIRRLWTNETKADEKTNSLPD